MKKSLVDNQCKGGALDGSEQDQDGSWDPKGHYEELCGRTYTSALGALCLEVYYRYLPIYEGGGPGPPPPPPTSPPPKDPGDNEF
jgi:hypothetical protein